MSRNLRPKSDLRFLKPAQSKAPVNGGYRSMKTQIEELKNVVKELEDRLERSEKKNEERAREFQPLEDRLERSEEKNVRIEREFQALEDEYRTVLTEMIKTKKENESLMEQLKIQQCVNECEQ